jgi:transposase
MPRPLRLVRHVPEEELEEMYRKERNPRTRERLHAILLLHDGKSAEEVSSMLRRSMRTIRYWISAWNEGDRRALSRTSRGGSRPRLSYEEWEDVLREIEDRGYTLKDVAFYVRDTRGVQYTYDGVWRVLRRKMKVRYGKPRRGEEDRPPDAGAILKFKE